MAKFKKERTYSIQQGNNLALGQAGSILVKGTDDITCLAGAGVFIAIQFLEDTVFDATNADVLVSETDQLFPSSEFTSTTVSSGGGVINGETFPQGMTIFGRWTGFKLASGMCIAYVG